MIEQLPGILVLCGFIGLVGCFVAPFLQPKCWTRHNKTTLARMIEQLCP